MLIESGFPINMKTITGMSPFYIAASLDHHEIALIIFDYIIESDMKESVKIEFISTLNKETNLSILSLAIIMNNESLAAKLIEAGA